MFFLTSLPDSLIIAVIAPMRVTKPTLYPAALVCAWHGTPPTPVAVDSEVQVLGDGHHAKVPRLEALALWTRQKIESQKRRRSLALGFLCIMSTEPVVGRRGVCLHGAPQIHNSSSQPASDVPRAWQRGAVRKGLSVKFIPCRHVMPTASMLSVCM